MRRKGRSGGGCTHEFEAAKHTVLRQRTRSLAEHMAALLQQLCLKGCKVWHGWKKLALKGLKCLPSAGVLLRRKGEHSLSMPPSPGSQTKLACESLCNPIWSLSQGCPNAQSLSACCTCEVPCQGTALLCSCICHQHRDNTNEPRVPAAASCPCCSRQPEVVPSRMVAAIKLQRCQHLRLKCAGWGYTEIHLSVPLI